MTCARVYLLAPLKTDVTYLLQLPQGTQYNPIAGPLSQDLSITVHGPRRFRIPFKQDYQQRSSATEVVYRGAQYRWGLAQYWWVINHSSASNGQPRLIPIIKGCFNGLNHKLD